MKPRVFLSHSSADKPIVRKFRQALAPFGAHLWLDELELLPGDSLFGRIGQEIQESDRVLAFISSSSVESRWVQRELNAFLAREHDVDEILVVPIVVDSVSVPVFLNDRLQVRADSLGFAQAVQGVLKGLFRHHAVLLAQFSGSGEVETSTLRDEVAEHKQLGLQGRLLVVADHYELTNAAVSAMASLGSDTRNRIEMAWPRCMHLFQALVPRLVQLSLEYFQGDVGAPAVASQTVKLVWQFVFLSLIHSIRQGVWRECIERGIPVEELTPEPLSGAFAELERLESRREARLGGRILGPLADLWLDYLNSTYDECLEIGFRGCSPNDSPAIFDAGHVLIRRSDVRWDSLTKFRDTPPEAEFLPATWIKSVLPYIAADAIIQIGYGGRELEEALPRIGLARDDFWYFGLE